MGEAKRRKQVDPNYGKKPKEPKPVIQLGNFMKLCEEGTITPSQREEAGIKDCERCVDFTIEGSKIRGVAFLSVDRKGKNCVDIIPSFEERGLSKIEEKILRSAEPEIRKIVIGAYNQLLSSTRTIRRREKNENF